MSESSVESQREEAYKRLRQNIIFLTYEPGTKLAMAHVSEDLGLGRTPVRSAFQQLEKEGLVNAIPQSGTYVTKIDMEKAEIARFTRETLEKEVAAECAALATRADIDRIDQAISLQRTAIDANERGDFFISDNLMHQAIFDIARKGSVWRWLNFSNADLERYRLIRVKSSGLDLDEVFDQHLQLRDAILRHDTSETRFLVAQHLHLMLNESPRVVALHPEYFA